MNTVDNVIDISFVLVCYNEYSFVVEALESIKYQIVEYGKEYKHQLIIADDCSSDGTRMIINKWLSGNDKLFDDIVCLYRKNNIGTAKNYVEAIRNCKGKAIISVSGDDLISPNNVINLALNCNGKKIVRCQSCAFDFGGIKIEKTYKVESLAVKYKSKRYLLESSKYFNNFSIGSLFSKDIFTDELLNFVEQFDLLEDMSRLFFVFSNYEDISIEYKNDVVSLYRKWEQQVTNKRSSSYARLCDDKKKLLDFSLSGSKNVFIKWHIRNRFFACAKPKLYRFTRLTDIYYIWRFIIKPSTIQKMLTDINEIYDQKQIRILNNYINDIRSSSIEYYER